MSIDGRVQAVVKLVLIKVNSGFGDGWAGSNLQAGFPLEKF
jgi:hypothetical protein